MSRWHPLLDALTGRTPSAALVWLREAVELAEKGGTVDAFSRTWSGAGRRLGRAPLAFTSEEAAALRTSVGFVPQGWGADEAGRGLLLLTHAETLLEAAHPALVDELFRTGDVRERQAVVRALPHLPEPHRFVEIGAEAIRTNMISVLEAFGCDNPYPAAHLPELLFNQLVMKMLFNALPLARVLGLERRRGSELVRMVEAWMSERSAAGRPIPDDVALVLGRKER